MPKALTVWLSYVAMLAALGLGAACAASSPCPPASKADGFGCREECRLMVQGCEFSATERFSDCERDLVRRPCDAQCRVDTGGEAQCHACLADAHASCTRDLERDKARCNARGSRV